MQWLMIFLGAMCTMPFFFVHNNIVCVEILVNCQFWVCVFYVLLFSVD